MGHTRYRALNTNSSHLLSNTTPLPYRWLTKTQNSKILIKGKPEPPTIDRTLSKSIDSSAQLFWNSSSDDGGDPITGYRVNVYPGVSGFPRETLNNEIENRPSWRRISAVRENKIFYINENLANNWGISSVELLRTIAKETEVLLPKQEKKVDSNIWQIYIVVIAALVLIMRRGVTIKEKT